MGMRGKSAPRGGRRLYGKGECQTRRPISAENIAGQSHVEATRSVGLMLIRGFAATATQASPLQQPAIRSTCDYPGNYRPLRPSKPRPPFRRYKLTRVFA